MEIIKFPSRDKDDVEVEIAINNMPAALRLLADDMENSKIKYTNLIWVLQSEEDMTMGLLGESFNEIETMYLMLGRAKRYIEEE